MSDHDRISKLEQVLENFRLISQDGITTVGSLRQGYAVHTPGIVNVPVEGFPVPMNPPPPPNPTGACCDGESCTVVTEAYCNDTIGGDYMGDGVPCEDPNPCAPNGACCEDGDCFITNWDDCGGIYMGDDTDCSVDCEGAVGGACCNGAVCTITTDDGCPGYYEGDGSTCDDDPCNPVCGSGCWYLGNCAGGLGFITETGCYCTINDSEEYNCQIVDGRGTYTKNLTFSYTTVYGWHMDAFDNCVTYTVSDTCDDCTINIHHFDGSETTCDCCVPGCNPGFCGDAGGVDCSCFDLEATSDTVMHDDSTGDNGHGGTCDCEADLTQS